MADYLETQWNEFQQRMKASAEYLADGKSDLKSTFEKEMADFLKESSPDSYPDLLKRIAKGTQLVLTWQEKSPRELASEAEPQTANQPFDESPNHEPIPEPTSTMADQAAEADEND